MRKKRRFGEEVAKRTSGASSENGGSLLMKRKRAEGADHADWTKGSQATRNSADGRRKKAEEHAPPAGSTVSTALSANGSAEGIC